MMKYQMSTADQYPLLTILMGVALWIILTLVVWLTVLGIRRHLRRRRALRMPR